MRSLVRRTRRLWAPGVTFLAVALATVRLAGCSAFSGVSQAVVDAAEEAGADAPTAMSSFSNP
jgi:hypothetical protein